MRNAHLTDEQLESIDEGMTVVFNLGGEVGGGRVVEVRALSFWLEVDADVLARTPAWHGQVIDGNVLGVDCGNVIGFMRNALSDDELDEITEDMTISFEINGVAGHGIVTETRALSFHIEVDAETLARFPDWADAAEHGEPIGVLREEVVGFA